MYVACDKWESRDLLIPIPDSVYNSGTVFIKKVTYKDVRGISLSMKMSGNQITSVELSGKGKKVKKILTELKENEEPTTRGTFCVSSSFLSFNGKRTKYLNSTRNL